MIVYLIKVALAMSFCLGIYHVFLVDRKSFVFNRFYLLLTMAFAYIAPFLHIPILEKAESVPLTFDESQAISDRSFQAEQETMLHPQVELISLMDVLSAMIILVSIMLLLRFIKNLGLQLYKSNSRSAIEIQGLRLISSDTISPYSFFRTLFVPYDMVEVPEEILRHERSHWRHLHSIDLLIIELLLVLQWYNPFLYLYRKALRDNHEYTADHDVIHQLVDKRSYVASILYYALPKNTEIQFSLSFNHSSTKKRIKMITANSKPSHPIFYVIVLLVTLISLGACGDLYENDGKEFYDNSDFFHAASDGFQEMNEEIKSLRSIGIDPSMVGNYRKLYPELVEKFRVSEVHFISYDGIKINNSDLKRYVEKSASFHVRGVQEQDPLFGKFEYRVSLLSKENHDYIRDDLYKKWRKEFLRSLRILSSNGEMVLTIQEVSTTTSPDIHLRAFNLKRNSFSAKVDGKELKEDVDYEVDYQLGKLKVLNDALRNEGVTILVSFESPNYE